MGDWTIFIEERFQSWSFGLWEIDQAIDELAGPENFNPDVGKHLSTYGYDVSIPILKANRPAVLCRLSAGWDKTLIQELRRAVSNIKKAQSAGVPWMCVSDAQKLRDRILHEVADMGVSDHVVQAVNLHLREIENIAVSPEDYPRLSIALPKAKAKIALQRMFERDILTASISPDGEVEVSTSRRPNV